MHLYCVSEKMSCQIKSISSFWAQVGQKIGIVQLNVARTVDIHTHSFIYILFEFTQMSSKQEAHVRKAVVYHRSFAQILKKKSEWIA